MARADRVGRWVLWTVPAMLAALLVADRVTMIEQAGPFDLGDLPSLVLAADEAPNGTDFAGTSTDLPLPELRMGARGFISSVFTSAPMDHIPPNHWSAYVPGSRYVVSSAHWFESEEGVGAYLEQVRSDLAWFAGERQRGPDGSWLVFHPAYEHAEGARPVPVAGAGWANGNVAFVVLHLGAESSGDALELARLLQARVFDAWSAGQP